MSSAKIHLIAGARPNFMKIAPLYHELVNQDWVNAKIVHTGQHYDTNMSDSFFQDLLLPDPHFHLGVGSGLHGEQTAKIILEYEKLCLKNRPDWAIVVGDVNSTIACSLVAAKMGIKVAHLEAGLRSRDRSMPEEINRLLTDQISDLLWIPSLDAKENLINEGIPEEKIEFVGNIMIDSYELLKDKINSDHTKQKFGLDNVEYGTVTFHRPSNVDDEEKLLKIINGIQNVSKKLKLIFPIHPRTKKMMDHFNLYNQLEVNSQIILCEPLSYIQFMNLVISSKILITDSGGIQEETSYLGIPCLTLRENTERPITIKKGTNQLCKAENLEKICLDVLGKIRPNEVNSLELWDGETAKRVLKSLENHIL